MTRGVVVLLLSSLPHWVMANWCLAGDNEVQHVFVVANTDGTNGQMKVQVSTDPVMVFADSDAGDVHGQPIVIATAVSVPGDGSAPADGQKHKIVLRKIETQGAPEDPNRGWLGVSVGEVPESLAAQLDNAQGGTIILNLVKDSPADRAGLQVHDIITSIGGEKIDGSNEKKVAQSANLIGSHKPGETINIVVLREGQQRTIRATLETRPDLKGVEWKYENTPHAQIEEQLKARGKVFQMGAGGQWEWKELGDLSKLHDLHKNFQFMPQGGNYTMKVFVDNGKKTVRAESKTDNGNVSVEQVDDGDITVRRTDASGRETAKSYDSAEDLRAADSEAADLFEHTSGNVMVKVDLDGLDLNDLGDIDVDVDVDIDDLGDKMEESFAQAQEAYQKAMEQFHEAYSQMEQQAQGGAKDGRSEPGAKNKAFWFAPGAPMPGAFVMGKAHQSFQVRPDGTIEVHIRKGDSEVVQLYTNETDLQRRDAKMYEKYRAVMSDDQD